MIADNNLYFALVEEQLADCPRVKVVLKGISMTPTLREGDRLTLGRVESEPVVGEVYLFRCCGHWLLHRLVGRNGDRLRMQGDHNYTCEKVGRDDLVAVLVGVERNGVAVDWRPRDRRLLHRAVLRRTVYSCVGMDGRRRLRPWYFGLLAVLMWAPLNGLGLPLDNYILGLRADHLLHASVYLPCTLFLWDLFRSKRRRGYRLAVWVAAVAVGLLTEGVQYLLPYRGFDVNDLVANTLGVTLGWVLILLLRHRFRVNR